MEGAAGASADAGDEAARLAPWERANWFSRASFHWMSRLMRGEVSIEQLLPVARVHSYEETGRRWGGTTRFRSFLAVYRRELLQGLAAAAVVYALQFFIVMFLFRNLALYLSDPTAVLGWGIALCCIMLLANVLQNFAFAFTWVENLNLGILAKAGFTAAVIDKAMRLRTPLEARVVNLISNDRCGRVLNVHVCVSLCVFVFLFHSPHCCFVPFSLVSTLPCFNPFFPSERMFEMSQYFLWVVAAPLQVATSCALICVLLGWAGVPCFAIVFGIILVNRRNGLLVGSIRRRALPVTDQRLGLIQELISAVKIVKIYCFEQSLSQSVLAKRSLEIATLRAANVVAALTAALVQGNATLVPMVCFVLYVGAVGPLSAATSFTVLALVNGLWFPMHMLGLGLARVGVGLQSFSRLEAFLQEPEAELPLRLPLGEGLGPCVTIDGAVFRRDESFAVTVNHLHFGVGLHMIVGPIGSGKSTLLLGALGLLPRERGAVTVRGEAAYAAQTAFIVNATVRENIVFGDAQPFDESRYREALAQSCLDVDVAGFVDGDFTEIGEKGINLSGGQRQRVSVARALYSGRPVLALDDCLSAVDVRVGRQLFSALQRAAQRCVVLLANHQLQHCAAARQVVVLAAGSVAQCGSFAELQGEEGPFRVMLQDYGHAEGEGEEKGEEKKVKEEPKQAAAALSSPSAAAAFVLIKAEAAAAGRVGAGVWWSYLRAGGLTFALSAAAMCVFMAGRSFTDFWLAYFVSGNTFNVSYAVWAGLQDLIRLFSFLFHVFKGCTEEWRGLFCSSSISATCISSGAVWLPRSGCTTPPFATCCTERCSFSTRRPLAAF